MEAPIIIVVGTRPDAIKLMPVFKALKRNGVPSLLCTIKQHTHLLDQVLDLFAVTPDLSLDVVREDASLASLTTGTLKAAQTLFNNYRPSLVMVQGDTTTAFAATLAAFYNRIPVAHIEAGLRTYDTQHPFPEEINRTLITPLATYHFAPTPLNVSALLSQGAQANRVFCVGNTVIDAVMMVKEKIAAGVLTLSESIKTMVSTLESREQRLVLVTTHRREAWDGGFDTIMRSLIAAAKKHPNLYFIFPVHPNPVVQAAVRAHDNLFPSNIARIHPLPYHEFLYLFELASWVMTDSGGLQEEAMILGKRVVVMREATERAEIIWDGLGILTGFNEYAITAAIDKIEQDRPIHRASRYVYGDGQSAERIVALLKKHHHRANVTSSPEGGLV